LKRPWLYNIAGHAARLTLRALPKWMIYNRFNIWGRQRDLPAAPKETFRELLRKRQQQRGER
jgi:L-lactate dehydrogenase complex protein LldF